MMPGVINWSACNCLVPPCHNQIVEVGGGKPSSPPGSSLSIFSYTPHRVSAVFLSNLKASVAFLSKLRASTAFYYSQKRS